jgi:hypothetical protein
VFFVDWSLLMGASYCSLYFLRHSVSIIVSAV